MTKHELTPYLLLAPALGLVVLMYAYPMVSAIGLSFYELYLVRSPISKFVGLRNFSELWGDEVFRLTMKNSVYWVVGSNLGFFVFGMGLALLANLKFRFRGIIRGIFILPWVIPVVVVGIIWRWIYNPQWGLLNNALLRLGVLSSPVGWLSNSKTMWPAIIFTNVWRAYGFVFICFLSGLQSIPPEAYEVASIDGANKWQKFIYITLPLMKPIIIIVFLLEIVWTYNNFNMVWLLTKGGPGLTSMVYGPFVYQQAFSFLRFGYASATGLVGFSIVLIFGIIYLTRVRID